MSEDIKEVKEEAAPVEAEPKQAAPAGEAVEKPAAAPAAAPTVAPAVTPAVTPAAAPRIMERPARSDYRERSDRRPRRAGGYYESGDGKEREPGSESPARIPKFKRKLCSFCQDKNVAIDYKRPEILERFITDRGKILPRRVTGTCSKHQRIVAREIKRARTIALLPFVEQ